MKYKHIFWDWNGTLVDDAKASWSAVNAMLDTRSLGKITFDQYRDYIDVPILRFYEKVMDISKESMEGLSKEFNNYCHEFQCENPLFPDSAKVLSYFSKKGINQYIFSSSHNRFIEPALCKYGIDHHFKAVIGAKDCYVGSKAERTRDYIISNGISPDESVFIGDMVHDSEVASFIGSDCILVASGHQSESALRSTGRKVVPSLASLLEIL